MGPDHVLFEIDIARVLVTFSVICAVLSPKGGQHVVRF